MYFVYLLRSISHPKMRYVGFTTNLDERIARHNAGGCVHTSRYAPWRLVSFVGFEDRQRALEFERYLKSGSGRAFSEKRLWDDHNPDMAPLHESDVTALGEA